MTGRKNWIQKISTPTPNSKRYWFHVSSLGEFEQARPVIESLKSLDDSIDVLLTFYSPSGYEVRKYYPQATTMYLPADLPGNARKFINAAKPDVVIFVKYDLWPGYVSELLKQRIPVILISAILDKGMNSSGNPLIKPLLPSFKKIFLQRSNPNISLWKNMEVVGDTRIDRVVQLPLEAKNHLPEFLTSEIVFDLIAGSTWPEDEKVIFENLPTIDGKILLAPHDTNENNLERIERECPTTIVRYQKYLEERIDAKVILMDGIGQLQYLYGSSRVAYIGGGFGKGIHNTLEPMTFGIPVIFGPEFSKFPEAESQVKNGGAFSIHSSKEFSGIWRFLTDDSNYHSSSQSNRDYILDNSGATPKVVEYLLKV